MSVKITKHGVSVSDLVYVGKCGHCGCQLECDAADAGIKCEEFTRYNLIKCPEPFCGKNVFLEVK